MASKTRVLPWLLAVALALGVPAGAPSAAGLPELDLGSPSVILMDVHTGSVLYEHGADDRLAPASVAKIMTLILIYEAVEQGRASMDDEVAASEHACSWGGSQIYLEPGEVMTLSELVLAIAVGSANDAAVVAAEHVAGSHRSFVAAMNEKARELGMKDTSFGNAHGLDDDALYTTARDVAVMSRHLLAHYAQSLEVTGIWDDYLRRGRTNEFWLVNTNRLLMDYPGADGIKTGWTEKAGFCVSATAVRGDTRLIGVVLGAESSAERFRDAGTLLNYGFSGYETVILAERGAAVKEIVVAAGEVERVNAVASDRLAVTIQRGRQGDLATRVEIAEQVKAPVTAGQVVGRMTVSLDGEDLAGTDLAAARDVPRGALWRLWLRVLSDLWPFL